MGSSINYVTLKGQGRGLSSGTLRDKGKRGYGKCSKFALRNLRTKQDINKGVVIYRGLGVCQLCMMKIGRSSGNTK